MIIDFHMHTYHSYDCIMKPANIIETAKKRGLTAIVVNDHNTIKGGIETQKINIDENFKVIVGAEIATNLGDISGIMLKEEISSRNFPDVVQEIKNQGGLVVLNHPFKAHKLDEINFDAIDLIEGYNSRIHQDLNNKAVALAKEKNIPYIAGSDAHIYSEIARCKTFYESDNLMEPTGFEYNRNPIYAEPFSQFIKSYKNKDLRLFINMILYSPKYAMKRFLGKI